MYTQRYQLQGGTPLLQLWISYCSHFSIVFRKKIKIQELQEKGHKYCVSLIEWTQTHFYSHFSILSLPSSPTRPQVLPTAVADEVLQGLSLQKVYHLSVTRPHCAWWDSDFLFHHKAICFFTDDCCYLLPNNLFIACWKTGENVETSKMYKCLRLQKTLSSTKLLLESF